MEMYIKICTVLLLCTSLTEEKSTRVKRDRHAPPLNVPTFRRDSVEHVPEADRDRSSPYLKYEEFGTKSLPLRTAVESVPDLSMNSRRLPLRDAVEKRPPPDEPLDPEEVFSPTQQQTIIPSGQLDFSSQNDFHSQPSVPQFPYNQYFPNQVAFTPFQTFPQTYFQKQQSLYSPFRHFQNVITDYRSSRPYRVDDSYQQLLPRPYGALAGRNLRLDDSFFGGGQKRRKKSAEEDAKKVVCYVQGMAAYRKDPLTFNADDIDPFICTHVIYSYATIDPITFEMVSNDEAYDIVQGGYRALTTLKQKNADLKVLISLGGSRGGGSHRFSTMVSNARKRRNFIQSAIIFLEQYGFDGMELNWQYPGAEELGGQVSDKEFFTAFIEEVSEVFKQKGWLLALSAPASRFRIEDGFEPSKVGEFVDFVSVQAYDFHTDREPVADHHTNLYARPEDTGLNIFLSVDYSVQYWLRKGLPRTKLVLGIPFFGRSFTLQYSNETDIGAGIKGPGREGFYTQSPGLLAYFEICDMILNEGWFRSQDSSGSPIIINGDQWVGYDDAESIKRKVDYAKVNGLGGISVAAADMDDFRGLCGEKWPLLTVVNRELKGVNPINEEQTHPTKPIGVCDSTGYYSDSKNCAAYYICKNGLTYHLSCGNSLMFNPLNGKCDQVNPQNCRPGETVHIPSTLKDVNFLMKKEAIKDNKPKVVCYVTNWAFYRKGEGKFVPERIDQRLCTHVVYAFASLDPEKLLIKEFDPWADLDNNLYDRITSLKDTTVLLSLGGWTDSSGNKYSRLVSDGTARRRFVVGAVSFLRKHGFRGLHFDWNYPTCWQSDCKRGPSSDKPNFSKLLQELKKEFDKENPPLVLAAAISGYKEVIDVAYDLPALGQSLDFMSVMTYDYHGAWERQTGHVSPLYSSPEDKYPQYNANFTMEYLVSSGAPREKLLLGIPFYGQSFSLSKKSTFSVGTSATGPGEAGEYTKQPGMLAYFEICNRVKNQKWIVNKNSPAAGPFAYGSDQWVGYEDVDSVKKKASYIKSKGFGGAVAWTIDLDDFTNRCCGGVFPLLSTIAREFGLISDKQVQGDCTKPEQPVTPPPLQATTGSDSGAAVTWWTNPTTTSTKAPTSTVWWVPESTTTKPTKKPTTTNWWTETSSVKPPTKPSTPSTTNWWTDTSSSKPSTKPPTKPSSSTVNWWTSTVKSTTKPSPTTISWWTETSSSKPSTTPSKKPITTTPWWATTKSTTRKPTSTPSSVTEKPTTIPTPAVIMPEVDVPTKKCTPGEYLPDPANCNAFYRCVSGELQKQYCAGGLHWNKNRRVCDWPTEAKCKPVKPAQQMRPMKMPLPQPSTWQTTTMRYTNTWPTRPTRTTTRRTTTVTTRTTTVSSSGYVSQPLEQECTTGAYYPHGECSSFYVCFDGQLIVQKCAPGLSFNAQTRICDWSFKVMCTGRRKMAERFTAIHNRYIGDRPQPYSSCEGNTFAPLPGDCGQYMHCQWGKYEIRQCAPGLHWNNEKKICDWPKAARCSEETETDNSIVEIEVKPEPPSGPVSAPWEPPTTSYPEWKPPSTTESSGNNWEWHPPIPPTSEKPPLSEPLKPFSGYFKVVCYFTNWAWYRKGAGKYLPEDIDENLCTHVVYGFAVLDYSNYIIKAHDSWADFDNQFYKRVTDFKSKGIKVSIAIGGWNDSLGDKYSKLVNNPAARRRFIEHVLKFLDKYNFDGLDLDWEYPKCWQVDCGRGPASDKPAFAEFVKELHAAFQPKGWLLSSAVSPSRRVIDAGYDVPVLSKYLDWIAVMCYDYHGQWDKITGHVAPMYEHPEDIDDTFNTNFTIHYWIEKGADRRKLVMGMPMYGQSFSLADNDKNGLNVATYGGGEAGEETRARGFLAYYEICRNVIEKGWKLVRDRKGRIGPYAYLRDQWVSFDDIGMIRHKSEYIKAMGLGGGMIWALDLDDFKNICGCEEYPLLRTINRVLRGYAVPEPKCILGKPQSAKPPTKPVLESSPSTLSPIPPTHPPTVTEPSHNPPEKKPCEGRLFVPHETDCNQYYLCNQGELQVQSCGSGLFWNVDHCDWPENAQCHPDGSTLAPVDVAAESTEAQERPETATESGYLPPVETGVTPSYPGTASQEEDEYKVVCYFTNWAWYRQGDGKYLPSDIDPELCTHINYGFAVLDGTTLTIKPHDSWADIDNEFYRKVVELKSKGIKVLIAIGGWNDSLGDKYSRLVNDPQARARFVKHVVEFIEKWGFDGLDLDWEYPKCWQVDCNRGPDSDKQGFADLVRELSEAFRPRRLLLSSAVSPSKAVIDAGYDVPVLSGYFDWIAIMTYDFHGHWDKQTGHVAPLYYYPEDTYDYFNANFSIHYWIEKGAPPSKLVMGMPLYGQSFSLADGGKRGLNEKSYGPGEAGEFTRAGGFLAFYEICERVRRRGWTVTRDPEGRIGPYAVHGNQWVSYDDISEIRRKSKLVKDWGLGGGMVWALDLDDFRNRCGCGRHPLLKTMNAELRGVQSDISLQNCT
nr:probable chitinase 10 isoform X2 [Leptinotarsa decemlineata]